MSDEEYVMTSAELERKIINIAKDHGVSIFQMRRDMIDSHYEAGKIEEELAERLKAIVNGQEILRNVDKAIQEWNES